MSARAMTGTERSGGGAPDALRESAEVQAEASALGFDWQDVAGVLEKVEEELGEIRAALEAGDAAQARRELGDLLLIAVNLARFLDAAPDVELRAATARFARRFEAVKARLRMRGVAPESCTLDELNAVWDEVKLGEGGRCTPPEAKS